MCPPWIEGAHMGAPLQEGALLTSMSATWYQKTIFVILSAAKNLSFIAFAKSFFRSLISTNPP